MTSPTNNIYSSELKELGSQLRELYIYILAYEEVVLNPEKYLEQGVRDELVKKGIINTNQSINIEIVNRNTDLLKAGKYQYVSFESLITGVSFNIFGYREGAGPDGRDLDLSGLDDSLTKNISREVQLLKLKWFVEGTPAPIKKSNYGGSTLVDTRILNEISTFTNGGPKSKLIAENGGFISSPFFEDEIVSSENYDLLFAALGALRTAFTSASIFQDGNSNRQSVSKNTEYNILSPDLAVDSPQSLRVKWTQLGGNYQTEEGLNLAFIYTTLFNSLKVFGFSRDETSPASPINVNNSYHQQFLNDVETIRRKLIGDTAAVAADRSALLQRNPIAGALTTNPEELILKKVPPPKLTPFDFQCYLLENISKLVDQRGNANYKHVIPVTTDGDPGSIINTIQHGGKTGAVKELLNICPEVYALLVPYLKISRLDYDKFGNVATDGNGRAIMSDLEIPNFLTQDDISDILSGRAGRATGAGIKSFSWSLDGVQPAEVDNNIKATLVMYFQSVNDFFNGASSAGQQTPNFLDLIINSPAVKKLKEKEGDDPEVKSCPDDLIKPELHKGYEGRNYRVKICAGWAVPDKETILELVKDDSKAENLVEAIADSRISLFLQMTQHQISFNQNGSLELTVDYQASLAGLLSGRTADIFDETPKLIKENIKGQEEIIDNIDDIDESNLTDSDKEKKKAALEEIKKIKNKDKNVKYKKLLKNIYSADAIRFISLNPNELSMTPYKDLTPKQRQKRVKRRNNETLEVSNVGSKRRAINQELIDSINKDPSADTTEVAKAYSEVATKSFEEMMKQDKIAIPFFYLGDLLDAVIEEIKINNSNNTSDGLKPLNFNFFISDVEMIDPLLAFKAKNLEDLINCGYNLREIEFIESASKETPTKNAELNGIYKTMNIGDIPISLDAFQLWFKNNVVKKGRENYFFLYFVKDVCKEMISRALSSKCFGKEFNFEQRFDTQPLTLAKQETKISNFTPNVLTTAQKISNAKASISCDLDPTQTELGLLLYPTDSNPKDLRGDYTKDVGRGIYHHYLGSSCGLVKKINFNRQDQPYLRESRIQKEGALGAEQLRELYSANIDLVGNTLYRNGMYIYINPSLIGASQEYLDYLGLHGYYLVTAVKSTVTPNSFDVSIEALHEGIEFKGNKLQPSAFDTGDFEGLDPERAPASIVQREIEDPLPAGVPGGGQDNAGYSISPLPEGTTSNDAYDDIVF